MALRCSFVVTLAILAGALLSAAAVRTELWVETTTISKPCQLPGQTIQGWKQTRCYHSKICRGSFAIGDKGFGLRGIRARPQGHEAYLAVSYTHLTLPTIYSV